MTIKVVPLGAGQDVGRSCILVTFEKTQRTVMLDCGMHMSYADERRYPDFAYLLGRPVVAQPAPRQRRPATTARQEQEADMNCLVDAVLVTHFHLDHCGALPYFTERVGYSGPVYMTFPTKAIAPILLEDNRKIASKQAAAAGETAPPEPYSQTDIRQCMAKVTALDVHQQVTVCEDLEIKTYYAGHVLGACMFWIRSGHETVVYTGDYNMTPDRHLGAAWIDRCVPDLLITESTYATMIRDSRRTREHEFLRKIHTTVAAGGKVLIPVFALGRAQELCILVDAYWQQMGLGDRVPVYFAGGITSAGNEYYKLFIQWTNEKIKRTFTEHNPFDFRCVRPFEMAFADQPGPQVLFASPGMLHQGTSFEVFRRWCGSAANMIILPGWCSPGTAGARLLLGERVIPAPRGPPLQVHMQVENLSFSAHADAKGIMQLCRMAAPRHIMLVHGEAARMAELRARIKTELCLPCSTPANGHVELINTMPVVPVSVSAALVSSAQQAAMRAKRRRLNAALASGSLDAALETLEPLTEVPLKGFMFTKSSSLPVESPLPTHYSLLGASEAVEILGGSEASGSKVKARSDNSS